MNASDLSSGTQQAARQSRSFIMGALQTQAGNVGQKLSTTAGDLRRIAGDLQSSETVAGGADLANRGADVIDRAGTYLQQADGEQMIADLEAFARERPLAVILASVVTGFAASRVLKASSSRRYRTTRYAA